MFRPGRFGKAVLCASIAMVLMIGLFALPRTARAVGHWLSFWPMYVVASGPEMYRGTIVDRVDIVAETEAFDFAEKLCVSNILGKSAAKHPKTLGLLFSINDAEQLRGKKGYAFTVTFKVHVDVSIIGGWKEKATMDITIPKKNIKGKQAVVTYLFPQEKLREILGEFEKNRSNLISHVDKWQLDGLVEGKRKFRLTRGKLDCP